MLDNVKDNRVNRREAASAGACNNTGDGIAIIKAGVYESCGCFAGYGYAVYLPLVDRCRPCIGNHSCKCDILISVHYSSQVWYDTKYRYINTVHIHSDGIARHIVSYRAAVIAE